MPATYPPEERAMPATPPLYPDWSLSVWHPRAAASETNP